MQVKVGDCVLDLRERTARIPRTTRYVSAGCDVVRGIVVEAASKKNAFRVIVQFPEGLRSRDSQFIAIDKEP